MSNAHANRRPGSIARCAAPALESVRSAHRVHGSTVATGKPMSLPLAARAPPREPRARIPARVRASGGAHRTSVRKAPEPPRSAAFFLPVDGLLMPATDLTPGPRAFDLKVHGRGAVAHVAWGVAAESALPPGEPSTEASSAQLGHAANAAVRSCRRTRRNDSIAAKGGAALSPPARERRQPTMASVPVRPMLLDALHERRRAKGTGRGQFQHPRQTAHPGELDHC